MPSRAPRRAGDCRGVARSDRARPGARRTHRRGARRARGDENAARVGQAGARTWRPAEAGRLSVLRPQRAGALRRPRTRPARSAALVLPLRAAKARRGGRPRRGGANRMARPRLRARGGIGGATPDPRAAPACERPRRAARPLRLAAQARRRRRRVDTAHDARADSLAPSRAARRPRAPSRRAGAAGACAAAGAAAPRRARRGATVRRCGSTTRPAPGARARLP